MLLIVTNSMDGTTDLLLPFIERKKEVFRFNVDLWKDYEISVTPFSFFIKDPLGRVITESKCSGFYLRKAYFIDEDRGRVAGGDLETWCQFQVQGIVDGLYSICNEKGLVRLVEIHAERRVPKIAQMRAASQFFCVPDWSIVVNPRALALDPPLICKPLRSAFVCDFKSMFATRILPAEIEPMYPWFLQSLVDSVGDLTVVFANGKCYPFFRERHVDAPVDYRESVDGQDDGWREVRLSGKMFASVCGFMQRLRLSFGRLDFVAYGKEYFFLEVNPNGQYAFLDPNNKTGLLSWIADCVSVGS